MSLEPLRVSKKVTIDDDIVLVHRIPPMMTASGRIIKPPSTKSAKLPPKRRRIGMTTAEARAYSANYRWRSKTGLKTVKC